MTTTLNLHVSAVNSATLTSDIMFISNKIRIAKRKHGEFLELDQRRVKIRENQNGIMALSYVAPVFEIIDIENFFDDVLSSEKLAMDIGGTGEFKVSYRGLIDGKGKDLPQNLDHKIILLQEPKCLDVRENIQITGFSKFKPRGRISE